MIDEVSGDRLYLKRPERDLRWTQYLPKDETETAPLILLIHGGGWRAGSRQTMEASAKAFASHGLVAIAIDYRFVTEARWPAALDDVKSAISFARDVFPAPQGENRKLFIAGYSAGAQLALLAAAEESCAVDGVAAFFPPARLGVTHAAMLDETDEDTLAQASPITVAGRLPPTILFTGDGDEITPAHHSAELHRAIREAGRKADLQIFSDLPHEFATLPGMTDVTAYNAVAFFRRNAIEKDSFSASVEDLRQFWRDMFNQ
jgi:acetyl esterase/lipase